MKYDRRMVLSIFWVLLGAALFICGTLEIVDSYWSGMGGGFLGVGIVQLIRHIRYRKNEEYREKVDIENKDERNRFIGGKAWAWAGYCYVMISAVGSVIAHMVGREDVRLFASFSVCLILVLYWVCWLFLRRKY